MGNCLLYLLVCFRVVSRKHSPSNGFLEMDEKWTICSPPNFPDPFKSQLGAPLCWCLSVGVAADGGRREAALCLSPCFMCYCSWGLAWEEQDIRFRQMEGRVIFKMKWVHKSHCEIGMTITAAVNTDFYLVSDRQLGNRLAFWGGEGERRPFN